jgi:hypothetical protein
MTKAVKVKSARNDIWEVGKAASRVVEKGKYKGQTVSSHDHSLPANSTDSLLVAQGQPYYWWQSRFGGKHISLTPPKRSQLTRSEWRSHAFALEESLKRATCETVAELERLLARTVGDIQDMLAEAETRLENMPEGLRENSQSGQTLQDYSAAFESWLSSDLAGIDTDIAEADLWAEAKLAYAQAMAEVASAAMAAADPKAVQAALDALSGADEIFNTKLEAAIAAVLEQIQATSSGL